MTFKNFKDQLQAVGLSSDAYLKEAKKLAKSSGYDPSKVSLSSDKNKKLQYKTPDGKDVKWGAVGYNDFIIYKHLENVGKVDAGTSEKKRKVFKTSHGAIKDKGKYSPNQLALNINW